MKFILFILLAVNTQAKEFKFTKQVTPELLRQELLQAGFEVQQIWCYETVNCSIYLKDTEFKDPTAIITAHVYKDIKAELKALDAKVTLTTAETRRFLKILYMMLDKG